MNERVKIDFQLNAEDQQGFETENVWAEKVGENEFLVLNSPFFVFGVSAEDIVSAQRHGNAYKFDHVVKPGGHSTYRVFLQGGRTIHDESFQSRWTEISKLGVTFENANDRLVSVDVPPGVDVVSFYALLKQGEDGGVWAFEEGNYEGAPVQE